MSIPGMCEKHGFTTSIRAEGQVDHRECPYCKIDELESTLAAAQEGNKRLQVWATRLIDASQGVQHEMERILRSFNDDVRAVREDAGQVALAAMLPKE